MRRVWFSSNRHVWVVVGVTMMASAACKDSLSGLNEGAVGGISFAFGNGFSAWSTPTGVAGLNTVALDGCPFISPDGKTFYMASNRSGSQGLDIWVSKRASTDDAWGEPVKAEGVNSSADDFCPTISRDGKLLYFVSSRPGCGMGDIYVARLRPDGFDAPEMLSCDNTEPYESVNSPFNEFSPFPQLDPGVGPVLYFSSFRPGGFAAEPAGGTADSDLYWSKSHGGTFDAADLIPAVNTTADDGQPNVGSDGRELYFYSTRAGGIGAADLYVSTRAFPLDAWSVPSNLGATVNSTAAETRPSLSWDGSSLYFGSTRAGGLGMSDIYVTTRQRLVP